MKKRNLVKCALVIALLTVSGPVSTYTHAQSAADASLGTLKQKATKEIDRRAAQYQKTLATLTDRSAKMSQDDKGTTVGAAMYNAEDGTATVVKVKKAIRENVRQYLEKLVAQLKKLKQKVSDTSTSTELRNLTYNVDAQYDLGKLTNIQANVMLSADSATEVLKNLKATHSKLEEQVTLMRDCMERRSSLADTLAARCNDFDLSSVDIIDEADIRLGNMKSLISSVGSLVSSVVVMVEGVEAQYGTMTKKIGGASSVQNIENVDTLLTDAQRQKLQSALSSTKNLNDGLVAVTSQLDIANTLTVTVSNQMNELVTFINRK